MFFNFVCEQEGPQSPIVMSYSDLRLILAKIMNYVLTSPGKAVDEPLDFDDVYTILRDPNFSRIPFSLAKDICPHLVRGGTFVCLVVDSMLCSRRT